MLSDLLTTKYFLLMILSIWGVLAIISLKQKLPAFLLGLVVFITLAYLALGTGFSIRIPYMHDKMEIIVYTIYEQRVHALAHPLGKPGEPIHIVFSIEPGTKAGSQMRKSFFDAVRAREGKRHKTNIIIDMDGYMIDHGVYKFGSSPVLPPKLQSLEGIN